MGLGVQRLVGAFGWVKRHYKAISIVSGSADGRRRRAAVHRRLHEVLRAALAVRARPVARAVAAPIRTDPPVRSRPPHVLLLVLAAFPAPVGRHGLADPPVDAHGADPAADVGGRLGGGLADPAVPNSPERAAQYLETHPLLGEFYRRAGPVRRLRIVVVHPVTVLLFVSLVACLIPRTRAAWRSLRARPVQAREIDAFRHYAECRGRPRRPMRSRSPARSLRAAPVPRGARPRAPMRSPRTRVRSARRGACCSTGRSS